MTRFGVTVCIPCGIGLTPAMAVSSGSVEVCVGMPRIYNGGCTTLY